MIVHCTTGLFAQWTLVGGWFGSLVSGIDLSGPRTCRPTWLVVCCLSHNFGFRDGVYLVQQGTDRSISGLRPASDGCVVHCRAAV